MNRLALRLSTLAALLGGGAADDDGEWPTIARDNIFDSRGDDIDTETDRLPVIVMRTDNDDRTITPAGYGTRDVDFRMQIGVMTATKDQDTQELLVGWPESDAAMEAFLDLLEWGVENALYGGSVWANWWRSLWGAGKMTSVPSFIESNQGRVRIAMREVSFTFDGFPMDETAPAKNSDEDPYIPTLPARLLAVFERIAGQGGGDFKDVCAALKTQLEEQYLPKAGVYPPLVSVNGKIFISRVAPPTGEEEVPSVEAELLVQP